MESDGHCPDEEVILAADRERSLVGLLPRALDGLQEGASFALPVRHRHVRDESMDVSVLAGGDNSRQVSQSRLPQNETLRPYLHSPSIARLGAAFGNVTRAGQAYDTAASAGLRQFAPLAANARPR